jgi:uncharacterized damage-inducible protein DinB
MRMAITDALLPEYDHELATTRRLLARVPDAELGWKPHEKSFTLGELAGHVANIPFWCTKTVQTTVFDVDTLGDAARVKAPESTAAMLAAFDTAVFDARAALAGCSDSEMMAPWTLKAGGQEIFTMPKIAAIRSFVMNHLIHHRGQLTVYLRLKDVPLPPIYGPTADEP